MYHFGLEYDTVDSQWKWSDGMVATWTFWDTSDSGNIQPNERSGEIYIIMYNLNTGRWHDAHTTSSGRIVCERFVTLNSGERLLVIHMPIVETSQ